MLQVLVGLKRPEREADHLSSTTELKTAWSFTSTPTHLHGMMLGHRDDFTFYPHLVNSCSYSAPVTSVLTLSNLSHRSECFIVVTRGGIREEMSGVCPRNR